MDQKKIDRINELAKKAKSEAGLTEKEKTERETLRREYIDNFKKNIAMHLDNIYTVDEHGNKKKLQTKKRTEN